MSNVLLLCEYIYIYFYLQGEPGRDGKVGKQGQPGQTVCFIAIN